MAKQVVFWQKIIKFKDEKGNSIPGRPELVACQAQVIGESELICDICHEPFAGHDRAGVRPQRKHLFTPLAGSTAKSSGLTLEVICANGDKEIRHNVMQGQEANCWTDK